MKNLLIAAFIGVFGVLGTLAPLPAAAERIRDLASIQGVRANQLMGYGLVVGLDGSGDQTTQTPFTVQSIIAMLSQLGVNLPPGTSLQLKNVAAVIVTATLPAFARPGQMLDVTVSSMGNAKSLRGGSLLLTPLKGADGQIYAMAQGNVVVSGYGAAGGGSAVKVNHLSAGRVPSGATVERAVASVLAQGESVKLELNSTDFDTARRIADVINRTVGPGIATALDGRVIEVQAPAGTNDRVGFLAQIENLSIDVSPGAARVIISTRTGSVVMNQSVTIEPCAVAHGNLTISIQSTPAVSQPSAFSTRGDTVVSDSVDIQIKQDGGNLMMLGRGAKLADVVKALNTLGADPLDLVSILQSMKAAGALRAELEVL